DHDFKAFARVIQVEQVLDAGSDALGLVVCDHHDRHRWLDWRTAAGLPKKPCAQPGHQRVSRIDISEQRKHDPERGEGRGRGVRPAITLRRTTARGKCRASVELPTSVPEPLMPYSLCGTTLF